MSAHVAASLSGPSVVVETAPPSEPFESGESRAVRSASGRSQGFRQSRGHDRLTKHKKDWGRTFVALEAALVELVDDAHDELAVVLAVKRRRPQHRAQGRDEEHEVRDGLRAAVEKGQ